MDNAVNQNQLTVAEIKRRQHGAMIRQIEREQSALSEEFKNRMVATLPKRMAIRAVSEWESLLRNIGETGANLWLLEIGDLAAKCLIPADASDRDICDLAQQKAKEASSLLQTIKRKNGRAALERYCRRNDIEQPPAKFDDGQAIARMTDEHWWRRQLRRIHSEQSENLAIALGYVHAKAGPYCSNEALSRRQQQNRRNRNTLEATELVSEDGEIMSLADIADSGLANKALRRAELMTRAKGYEEIALDLGHVGLFVTLTCPARMHARLHRSSQTNPTHDGSKPRDGHAYLQTNWGRMRAKFERLGIRPYGLRIAEPHHDGTPHWHMLVFVDQERKAEVIAIMRDYALQDSPNEPGANKYRFKVEEIRRERGSAVGYLVKYVCKNIDGEGLESDLEGVAANESAARAEAWARSHSIRQFQSFGVPPVSIWRELRRIPREGIAGAPAAIKEAHEAAQKTEEHQADFASFLRACGGVGLKRSDYLLTVATEDKQIQGRYGLSVTARPVGVALTHCRERIFRSNRRVWTPFRRAKAADALPPWTCVNNCTRSTDQAVTKNPPWWKPENEWESTAKDADGFLIGVFTGPLWKRTDSVRQHGTKEAGKRMGSNASAPARLPPDHNRMIGAFEHGYQTA
ncbi:replication endonuclease [Azonexus hydrophilus]|uniref:replication endonuclease n=1 Tax=Azonexus hydrophilus TaxID=418702 RepID=UPI0006873D25|nr:replication endonuclease [Azonexus hydrophilus]